MAKIIISDKTGYVKTIILNREVNPAVGETMELQHNAEELGGVGWKIK